MIIIRLQGGLGNQMFQLAFAKSLSVQHHQPLLLDTSLLKTIGSNQPDFTVRSYALDIFQHGLEIATESRVKRYLNYPFYKKCLKFLRLPYPKAFFEDPKGSPGQLNNISFPVILEGYWQSEAYFHQHAELIREMFSFRQSEMAEVETIASEIARENAVAIHVRRGDYVTNPAAKEVLGTLEMSYYTRSIDKILQMVNNPVFYVFSDEQDWVKSNFLPHVEYRLIEKSPQYQDYYDLFLMSRCKHNIIANSSFSWWAGWLNSNPNKIVIAPHRWFKADQLHRYATGLIPGSWHSL